MNAGTETLSKRYAIAFYRSFRSSINPEEINRMEQLSQFFTANRYILLALCTALSGKQIGHQALKPLIKHFGLSPSTATLIEVLTSRNNTCLLPGIIRHLQRLYDLQHNNVVYTISSSHPLQDEQKKTILRFVQQANKNSTVVAHFKLLPELISGLRITSNELLWERSIRKVLSHLKHRWVTRT